ncbi:hypothetical protein WA577_004198, partial [Blastocystis sp. JDR]
MPPFVDSLSDSSERSVEWKYTGHFLQMGVLHYTQPKTHKQLDYECVRRTTKKQQIDGVFILPIIKGSAYKEPHILVIKGYRAPVESFSLSFPAGLVDEGEQPSETALRELKEETGYTGELIEPILPFSYFCDPWKSNEEQMIFVAEIDMDREENKHPKQCLEDTEIISTFIVPISTLGSF